LIITVGAVVIGSFLEERIHFSNNINLRVFTSLGSISKYIFFSSD